MKTIDKFGSDHKQRVRNLIHQTFVDEKCESVIFFPSTKRYELDNLLAHGFLLKNLHAIESHPQRQSNFTRLLSSDEKQVLTQYRAKLSEAAVSMKKKGTVVDAANLDFCCSIAAAAPEITDFIHAGVLTAEAVVAIQVFGGRDHVRGYARELALEQAIKKGLTKRQSCEKLYSHTYRNERSTSNMQYACFKIISRREK
jgi:hypothetical protein